MLTYLFFQLFSGSSSVSKPLSFLIPVVTYWNIKILGCLIYQQFSKLRFFVFQEPWMFLALSTILPHQYD